MDIKTLQSRIAGTVTLSSDPAYEQLRRDMVWHELKPTRRPAAIVQVANEQDVVESVRFAREQNLNVAVHGAGHNWCGFSLRDGSLMIDLGRLTNYSIDREKRTAWIQPIVRSRDFNRELYAQGLAFPVGHCPTVPLGGFLLNGGLGWNSNAWRPGCYSVEAMDIVTADGNLVRASETENPELLWAAHGCGPGFFGVITKLSLKLRPLPGGIRTTTHYYPVQKSVEVGEWFSTVIGKLPEDVEVLIFFAPAPADLAAQAKSGNGYVCILSATSFLDTEKESSAALSVLDGAPAALECLKKEANQPTTVDALLEFGSQLWPERHRYVSDTVWTNVPAPELLRPLRDHFLKAPSSKSLGTVWFSTGPNGVASPQPDAAYSMGGRNLTLCYAIWEGPEGDAAHVGWHDQMMAALEPIAVGHYVGESEIVRRPHHHERSFAQPNWERLKQLRKKYDPDGLFLGPFTRG
ncbi:MAG: FAD-binding oxidoreductase [Candidatus Binatia bacterium]